MKINFTLSGNRTQGLRMASGDFTTKPTMLHRLGIEPRATAWKAVMLPLHQQCYQTPIFTFHPKAPIPPVLLVNVSLNIF